MQTTPCYKQIYFILLFVFLASCMSHKSTITNRQHMEKDEIINYADKFLHTPYRYGANGPTHFDCSGFTSFVFKKFNYSLGSSSAGQSRQVKTLINKKEDLDIGDLVFFEGQRRNGRVGHVGIVSQKNKNGSFKFIHASTSYGVIYSSSEEPYYKARYLHGGRVLQEPQQLLDKDDDSKKQSNLQTAITQVRQGKRNDSIQKESQEASLNDSTENSIRHIRKENGTILIKAGSNESSTTSITKKAIVDSGNKTNDKKGEENNEKNAQNQLVTILSNESRLPSPPSNNIHIVKPGDSLFSISRSYGCSVEQLKEWNPHIKNNSIYAGEKIFIYK